MQLVQKRHYFYVKQRHCNDTFDDNSKTIIVKCIYLTFSCIASSNKLLLLRKIEKLF